MAGAAYSFTLTALILKTMNYIPGLQLRADDDAETMGMDEAEMGEFAVCPFPFASSYHFLTLPTIMHTKTNTDNPAPNKQYDYVETHRTVDPIPRLTPRKASTDSTTLRRMLQNRPNSPQGEDLRHPRQKSVDLTTGFAGPLNSHMSMLPGDRDVMFKGQETGVRQGSLDEMKAALGAGPPPGMMGAVAHSRSRE